MSNGTDQGPSASFPTVIYNPPGLSAIDYRVGDFSSFREALLQNLPGEVELTGWRPTADGDLALQLLEWWAYIADIITFYNERIANNSYIGTAVLPVLAQTNPAPAPTSGSSATPGLPDNATLIAGALGFKATPGIAATGQLAVLVNSKTSITLPPNFAIQSKPGPGQQPQVFEAVASTNTYLPTVSGGAVPVDLSWPTCFTPAGVTIDPAAPSPPTQQGPLVKGAISGIKPSDMVVIAEIAPPLANATSMAVTVQSVTTENDPRGRANTRLTLVTPFTLPASFTSGTSPDVTACQVLRGIQSAATYAFSNASSGAALTAPAVCGLVPSASPVGVHLASLVRDIAVGDLVVLEIVTIATPPPAGSASYVTAVVSTYQETIWYANADDPSTAPQNPPDASTTDPPTEIAIPIPHTFITLESTVETGTLAAMDPSAQAVTQTVTRVWYGYRPVSTLLDEIPVSQIQSASTLAQYNVQPAGVVSPTFPTGTVVLVEGTDGLGATATLTAPLTTSGLIKLTSSDTVPLALPLRLLFNVIDVTAGKTITNEVLGSGDGTVASQWFTLAKAPLTYLPGANPGVPVSTLQVQVDNVAWTEVANFNGQAASAKVFVTQQDKNQNTTVTFGDGVHGSRLSTGTGNVTASYRYGSGPGDPNLGGPPPTTLVTILTPYPGLGSVRNPVPMTGGAAPSTPVQVQQSAPSATLTFGHAVSPSDYQAIVAQTPSVARAQVGMGWDPVRRRSVTTVYVDGAPGAVAAAQAALAPATDSNRPPVVAAATAVDLGIGFNLSYDPAFDQSGIASAVTTALADPVTGLFAAANIGIGQTLYDSQIYGACLSVPGVLAVRALTIANITDPSLAVPLSGVAHSPGPGGFFSLAAGNVDISLEAGSG